MQLLWSHDPPAPGAAQMAGDRRMLERAVEGHGLVLLRVYRFHPRTLSLGYHQPPTCLDVDAARRDGIDVVRRPTGGAAVLHHQEWTYAAAGSWSGAGLGRPREVYRVLCDSLAEALRAVGVVARPGGGGVATGTACFEAAGGHELVVQGRKLVGSALRTRRGGWLQHGSLLTGPGHLDLVDYLPLGASPRARLRRRMAARTVGLDELLPEGLPSRREFTGRLAAALAQRLGCSAEEAGSVEVAARA